MVVAHIFNSSTWEAGAGRSEFEACLVYIVGSRTAWALLYKKPLLETNCNKTPKTSRRWSVEGQLKGSHGEVSFHAGVRLFSDGVDGVIHTPVSVQ